jgi:hypothetical protein
MEVSAQSLARLAAERQFQPATLERVIRLLDILQLGHIGGGSHQCRAIVERSVVKLIDRPSLADTP